MKDYKFKIIFSSKIRPLVSEEVDKYISFASNNFKHLFPKTIDFDKKIDFLGIYGNLCVANRLNSNDDGVSTKEAMEIADTVPFSLIDIEHGRSNCIGVLTQASFSSFGDNKPLTQDELKDYKKPFNVVVGGVIWKAVNPDLAEYIENNAGDLDEPIAFSWEVGFSEYNLIEISASKKNFEDGKIITDEEEIDKLSKFLKAEGGKGFLDNGKKIGRVPKGEVILIGAALTNNPAADVPSIKVVSASKKEENTEAIADFKGFSDTSSKEAYSDNDKSEQIKNKPVQQDVIEMVKNETKSKTEPTKNIKEQPIEQNNIPKSDPVIDKNLTPKFINYKFGKCPNCGNVSDYNSFIKHWNTSEGVIHCDSCTKKSLATSWEFNEVNIWKQNKTADNIAEEKKQAITAGENDKSENKMSHLENINVNKDNNKIMKISSINDITDENLKECKASDIREMVTSELQKISDNWEKDKKEKEGLVTSTKEQFEQAKANLEETKKELDKVKEDLNKIKLENEAKARSEAFSARMSTLDDKFELNDKEKEILGNKVKNIEKDEDFNKFLEETEILLAAKKKMPKKDDKKDDDDDDDDDDSKDGKKDQKDMKASKSEDKKDENAVETAVDNGEKTEVAIANTTVGSAPSLQERMRSAFGTENWSVESIASKRKNR